MKKFYQYFGIMVIMLFSFYYTEKIAVLMQKKDPLYQEIEASKVNEEITSVNAIIDGDYIVPGVNGLSVNAHKSFQKLKSFGVFNRYYLFFDQVVPEISLENNKDKIIKEGNKQKKSVAIVLEYNEEKIDYLKNKNKNFSVLVTSESRKTDATYEQINHDFKNYKEVDKELDKNSQNVHICIIDSSNLETCKKNKKYLVEKNLELNSTNIAKIKGNISSGSIIFVNQTATTVDLDILLKQIDSQGLKVTSLSTLILEANEKD